MFWALAALLGALAAAALLLPALRRPRALPERTEFDRAVYKDQLAEIDRDLERGLLTPDQAKAARTEVERRLLATAGTTRRRAAPARGAVPVLVATAGIVLAGSAALYLALGAPELPGQPAAERVPPHASRDMVASVEKLEQRLAANPNDAEGWRLLARSQAVLERYPAAARSYRRALELAGERPELLAGYGEMLVLSSDGTVTPAAREAFARAVRADPSNMPARYYLGVAAAQDGKPEEAIAAWRKLEAEAPPDAPWRAGIRQRIEETAREAGLAVPEAPRGPSAGDVAAAQRMSPEERQGMIRSMVENLAARLEETPDDAGGWQRLGRAYRVLGEKEKATQALGRVAALRPNDAEARLDHARAILDAAGGADPRKPLPEAFLAEIRAVAALEPRNAEALWYLGLAAAQQQNRAEARKHWEQLLTVLPPGSEDAKMVQSALGALGPN